MDRRPRPAPRSGTPAPATATATTTQKAPARATIEKLVPGGHGLARDHDGVFFVDSVAPGEVVEVVVDGKKGGARRARLLRVIEPSAERVTPDCPLFERCGGCDWLHLSRAAQSAGKERIVDDTLVRIARFTADEVRAFRRPLLVPPAGEKRRRARFVVDGTGRLSFSRRNSNERVAIPACPALDPRLSDLLSTVPPLPAGAEVRLAVDDGGVHVAVRRGLQQAFAGARSVTFDDAAPITPITPDENEPGAHFLVGEVTGGAFPAWSDAATFTQATRFGAAAIRDEVVRGAGDVSGHGVLELFAGAGHLTIPLALAGARVDAVEGDLRALHWLGVNARRTGAAIKVRRAFIDDNLEFGADVDVVVADPPRTGIPGAARLLRRFADRGVQRIVLVSCDPATGARDLRAAVDAGFVVDALTPIDAFPRTHHVEWVAVLRRG